MRLLILVLVATSITIDAANRNSQCVLVQPTEAELGFTFQSRQARWRHDRFGIWKRQTCSADLLFAVSDRRRPASVSTD